MTDKKITFPAVEAALKEPLETTEAGIQVAAYLDGKLIVDTFGGVADPDKGTPVTADTLFCPFSVTKSVTATALHLQAARGYVNYDEPIATYWPGFAQNGKDKITVRHVLTHQSGVPWMPDGITPELQADWQWMIRGFEQMTPAYEIGTNCYHALGWGWILAEVINRTDPKGRFFPQFVKEELLDLIGATDMFFGLPESEDHRLAKLVGGEIPKTPPFPMFFRGMPHEVHPSAEIFNTEVARRTVHPGAGVLTNARSMAAHFGLLANKGTLNGNQLLDSDTVMDFLRGRENGGQEDLYLGMKVPVSAYGYYLSNETPGMIPVITPHSPILWMPGAGSSIGWAELDTGLAVAITHNHMQMTPPPSFVAIAKAIREVATQIKS